MPNPTTDQFKYTEHERKPIIRTKWCLPQIELLFKKLKKKMIYIGLPGIEALDVKAWIDYLNRVVAFQCSEYKEGATTIKMNVAYLDGILNQMEREAKLTSSIVYQGFMEDIVMGGLSERGQMYSQDDFLKIYNLDFCNNITTPRTIRNDRGKLVYHYKLEVIERLLSYQKSASDQNKGSKFLMYLTVNSNIFDGDVSNIQDSDFKAYKKKLKPITRPEVIATRFMKAYCFYEITSLFKKHNFNVEFLPPIFYFGSAYPNQNKGSRDQYHLMMTFTILGTRLDAGQDVYIQDPKVFLDSQFMFATDKEMKCYDDKSIKEVSFDPSPTKLLTESHTFKNLWT